MVTLTLSGGGTTEAALVGALPPLIGVGLAEDSLLLHGRVDLVSQWYIWIAVGS